MRRPVSAPSLRDPACSSAVQRGGPPARRRPRAADAGQGGPAPTRLVGAPTRADDPK